ncbi:MAG: 1-acyl-sn-glycerol-3-phosphate acyltransferase, partial [Cyclobacteriaceae bacterium]|nr:1-acyl-sn-glycerol-3-phosphate acyltransferase [Cyclobacteriaceae bacterium]
MLYFVLSIVIRIALKIFFRRITIKGKENIPQGGALIVVGNHPNTFMDPILTALVMLPRQVHFLANGSIFKTRAARMVLNQFNTIPVYRKQDVTDKRDEKNWKAFQEIPNTVSKVKSMRAHVEAPLAERFGGKAETLGRA